MCVCVRNVCVCVFVRVCVCVCVCVCACVRGVYVMKLISVSIAKRVLMQIESPYFDGTVLCVC